MTLRSYLTMMILATAICWSAFAVVINTVNPESTNWVGFSLFYGSLFLALVGTASLVGFFIRFIALSRQLVFRQVVVAFRQAFSFALLIILLLIFQAQGMLTWYNIVLLIIALTVLEFFLISYKRA